MSLASRDVSELVPPEPVASAWVQRWAHAIRPGGVVLDLACGSGRHARHLAALGHPVYAVDRDATLLAPLEAWSNIRSTCADLEGGPWPYEGVFFDGIVATNYLHRPLLHRLAASLAAGGVLIYETFRSGNESYGKPSNPDFLLRQGELLEFARAAGLVPVAFEDGFCATPKPAMIQRVCAIRPPLFTPEQGRLG